MRWLKWTLSTLIILLIPIWLLLLVPKLNGFGPESLKRELKQQNTYEQLSTILHQTGDQPNPGEAEVTDQALVVLRSALSSDYLETKSAKAIDDTTSWLTNSTTTEPTLDINDIKHKVLTAYPDAQIQISQLQSELAAAGQELNNNPMPVDGIEGLESDGSASTIEIAKLLQETDSLQNFVAGDFKINLGPVLAPLYHFYQYYQIAIPVVAVILSLLLIVTMVLNKSWQSRIKNLGWIFVSAGIVNGILAAVFSLVVLELGLKIAISMLPNQAQVVGSIGQAITNSLYANYLTLEMLFTAPLLILGIALLLGAKYISKPRINTGKSTLATSNDSSPMVNAESSPAPSSSTQSSELK